MSPMFSAAMMASSRSASWVNFLRAMVSIGVAIIRVRSLVATPMVLEPRSSPISRWSARDGGDGVGEGEVGGGHG